MEYKVIELKAEDAILSKSVATLIGESTNDSILISNSLDSLIESLSYLPIHLSGSCHFHPLYGRHIHSLEDLCYQSSRTFPREYPIKADIHALYDLLLGFETEPEKRIIIWHDAQVFFEEDRDAFEQTVEVLITASLMNRLGIATVKENGSPYHVKQSCVFGFHYPTGRSSEIFASFTRIFENMKKNGPEDPLFISSVQSSPIQILTPVLNVLRLCSKVANTSNAGRF